MITDSMERQAEQAGIRLEFINGIPVWEASPVIRHQRIVDRIRGSIAGGGYVNGGNGSGCACVHYADIYIKFPDGSLKRPDISLFCSEPPEEDSICETIPHVVIEVLSKGYEKKDIDVSLPFYLVQGIPDIVLFDPIANRVSHYREGVATHHDSPISLTFACGCTATV